MLTIAHLTSAHPRRDTRIFIKQCQSLAHHGHDVTLVVADGKGDEVVGAVRVSDVGAPGGRMDACCSPRAACCGARSNSTPTSTTCTIPN
ncbi:hypothetical protein [Massilia antarctica]|uniref:hypothetical protein n=1 Tax=Massilia antarctica TaxID=2765360 RepID=UPI00226E738B|nr:hypothetical protein [Massilia sp. H27-R4]MCY0910721.1 hypothetical protein [Massilia sp. H27-R4]